MIATPSACGWSPGISRVLTTSPVGVISITAMQNYATKDYPKAIPGLRAALKANPQAPSFNFYLGAGYLLTDRTDPAIVYLRKTISLGNPAYSESAHFYLAKAYLKKKDVSAAEEELQKTVQFHGSRETEAEEILRELRK